VVATGSINLNALLARSEAHVELGCGVSCEEWLADLARTLDILLKKTPLTKEDMVLNPAAVHKA
jgi:hypothetical protein